MNELSKQAPADPKPIDMILYCPNCGTQHIDGIEYDDDDYQASVMAGRQSPRWVNPPHRSHLCEDCGSIWRPADVPTNGVKAIASKGQKDSWRNGKLSIHSDEDYEIRGDGQRVRKDRWQSGVRNIAGTLGFSREEFEIPDIVERVGALVEWYEAASSTPDPCPTPDPWRTASTESPADGTAVKARISMTLVYQEDNGIPKYRDPRSKAWVSSGNLEWRHLVDGEA